MEGFTQKRYQNRQIDTNGANANPPMASSRFGGASGALRDKHMILLDFVVGHMVGHKWGTWAFGGAQE